MASCFEYRRNRLSKVASKDAHIMETSSCVEYHDEPAINICCAMLGLSETGKSTIVKGMKCLFKDAYGKADERKLYIIMIYRNILSILKEIINRTKRRSIKMDEDIQISAARIFMCHMQSDAMTTQLVADIKNVWRDFKQKTCIESIIDFSSVDNAAHFLDSIDRICSPDYVPTVEDILKCKTKTATISEVEFTVDNIHFNVIDMGGYKNEREKWARGMEDAEAIMYCVALSDYDQYLEEDRSINCMQESLKTFADILREFPNRIIFLCFTKRALFSTKITKPDKDLSACFKEYNGGADYNNALEFIMQKFSDINSNSTNTQKVYASVINAIETKEISSMVNSAVRIVKRMSIVPAINT